MKTLAQVRSEYVADAAAEFLSVLTSRVEEGLKTEAEAGLYRSRLPRAILLATTDHMILQASPGVYDVWSTGKHMDQVYTVDTQKKTCSCPDADPQKGKAPQGYCKHRLACFLTMRADRGIAILGSRLEGLRLPHGHVYECGHEHLEPCWDSACVTAQDDALCESCNPSTHVLSLEEERQMREDAAFGKEESLPACHDKECQTAPIYTPPAQYEVATPYERKADPLPEAPASLNLKFKKGQCEFMLTMRAHTDQEILERLPAMLKGLREQLGISFHTE